MKGEADSWQLLTEPQGGSDLASAKTTALLDGDDYIVNGQKIFVGSQHLMEYAFTIVNSDPQGARHRNLSYLIIPLDAPGITIQPLYLLNSAPPAGHKNIVFFDDVRIPQFNRIGAHNDGWKVASVNMELEHGGAGNISEDRNLHRLIECLKDIQWEGKPLIEDPDIRDILGELLVERETHRLFGLRNYWMAQTRQRMEHEGPQLSLWTKSRAHSIQQRVQAMLGHLALTRDPKYMVAKGFLELAQRNVFVTVHAGGGLNIQATIVARRLGLGRNAREEAARLD
jgi:alkylation response protein AidB-like acyl-CoA dehydrogenase